MTDFTTNVVDTVFRKFPCPSCQTLVLPASTIKRTDESIEKYIETITAVVYQNCQNCNVRVCIGCHDIVVDNLKHDCTISKALFLSSALHYTFQIYKSFSNKNVKSIKCKDRFKGTGYSSGSIQDSDQTIVEEMQLKETNQENNDKIMTNCLRIVRKMLPDPERTPSTFNTDFIPHDCMQNLVSHSGLLSVLKDYMINDSLTDISKRFEVYKVIFGLLDVFSNHESLAGLLVVHSTTCNTLKDWVSVKKANKFKKLLTFCEKKQFKKTNAKSSMTTDSSASLLTLLTKLQTQAKVFSTTFYNQIESEPEDSIDEVLKLLSVSSEISSLFTRIQNRLSLLSLCNKETDTPIVSKKDERVLDYIEVMKKESFKTVHLWSDLTPFPKENTTANVVHLSREFCTLATSLPCSPGSSVFVRIDDTNITAIKVLITGPEGTPYSNGCFEFVVLFTSDYPDLPPKVTFETTGGGTVRFNPNLYNNGKVCLSLLGTWSGSASEMWTRKSTLLQLFTSIQSMIFTEYPYCNEPGFENFKHSKASKDYNTRVQRDCVSLAMIDMLDHPPFGFESVVKKHFYLKRKVILKQVSRWVVEESVSKAEFKLLKEKLLAIDQSVLST